MSELSRASPVTKAIITPFFSCTFGKRIVNSGMPRTKSKYGSVMHCDIGLRLLSLHSWQGHHDDDYYHHYYDYKRYYYYYYRYY